MKPLLWILGAFVAVQWFTQQTPAGPVAVPETATPDNVSSRLPPAPTLVGPWTGSGPLVIGAGGPGTPGAIRYWLMPVPTDLPAGQTINAIVDCRQTASTYPHCVPTIVDPIIGY